MGDGPARRTGDEAHAFLQSIAIQFVDHAVDVEGQCIALRTDLAVVIQQALQPLRSARLVRHRKPQVAQYPQALRVRGRQYDALGYTQGIGVKRQWTLRCDARIELT